MWWPWGIPHTYTHKVIVHVMCVYLYSVYMCSTSDNWITCKFFMFNFMFEVNNIHFLQITKVLFFVLIPGNPGLYIGGEP